MAFPGVRTVRCAVLGDPIAHSLSPALHRAGYAALGLDWSYDAVRVADGGLAAYLRGLDPTWRGLSLTMPLKREAMALADQVSERAASGRRRQHPAPGRRARRTPTTPTSLEPWPPCASAGTGR